MTIIVIFEPIEGWVLGQSPEKVRPCQIVYAVLELLQRSTCNLGIDMVSDLPSKRAFDWERLIQELFVEVLLLLRNEDTSDTTVIELRSTSSSDHLEKISEWEIHISLQLSIIELRPFDDHKPCREVDTPCQSAGGHQYLYLLLDE